MIENIARRLPVDIKWRWAVAEGRGHHTMQRCACKPLRTITNIIKTASSRRYKASKAGDYAITHRPQNDLVFMTDSGMKWSYASAISYGDHHESCKWNISDFEVYVLKESKLISRNYQKFIKQDHWGEINIFLNYYIVTPAPAPRREPNSITKPYQEFPMVLGFEPGHLRTHVSVVR